MHPKRIDFNGYKFKLSGKYYRRHNWGKKGPSSLHRAVWEFHNGAIPENHDIHHINGDTMDNSIENLAVVHRSEHQRNHLVERIKRGEMLPPGQSARAKAAEWHGSAEGLKWHSTHGKNTWKKRMPATVRCKQCGKQYKTAFPTTSKWCSLRCKLDARTEAKGGVPRAKRIPVQCVCKECGQAFMSTVLERVLYCSQNCGTTAHRRRTGQAVGVRPYRRKARVLSGKRTACKQL